MCNVLIVTQNFHNFVSGFVCVIQVCTTSTCNSRKDKSLLQQLEEPLKFAILSGCTEIACMWCPMLRNLTVPLHFLNFSPNEEFKHFS